MYSYMFALLIVAILPRLHGAKSESDSTTPTLRQASHSILFKINNIKNWGCRVQKSESISEFITTLRNDAQPLIKDDAVLTLRHKENTLTLSQNNHNNLLETLRTIGYMHL